MVQLHNVIIHQWTEDFFFNSAEDKILATTGGRMTCRLKGGEWVATDQWASKAKKVVLQPVDVQPTDRPEGPFYELICPQPRPNDSREIEI